MNSKLVICHLVLSHALNIYISLWMENLKYSHFYTIKDENVKSMKGKDRILYKNSKYIIKLKIANTQYNE